MSLSDITGKIHADAEKNRDDILRTAQTTIEKLTQEAEAQKLQKRELFEQETATLLEKNVQKVVAGAKQEAKKLIDGTKRQAIDSVFTTALKKLVNADDVAYENSLTSLLQTLPKDTTGTLKTPSKRTSQTENALQKAGLKLSIETDESISGGCVIVGDTYEYNLTFDKLIADKKSDVEVEVAHILFS